MEKRSTTTETQNPELPLEQNKNFLPAGPKHQSCTEEPFNKSAPPQKMFCYSCYVLSCKKAQGFFKSSALLIYLKQNLPCKTFTENNSKLESWSLTTALGKKQSCLCSQETLQPRSVLGSKLPYCNISRTQRCCSLQLCDIL